MLLELLKKMGDRVRLERERFEQLVEYMRFYGDIPEHGEVEPSDIATAVFGLQKAAKRVWPSLQVDGIPGELTLRVLERLHRCKSRPVEAARQAQIGDGWWGISPLTYYRVDAVGGLTARRQDEILAGHADQVRELCGLDMQPAKTASAAQMSFHAGTSRAYGFGRPGGTLGSAEIPPTPNYRSRPLNGDLDAAEPWTEDLYRDVTLHEFFGHMLGLAHWTGRERSIMEPFHWNYGGRFQPVDVATLVRKYGERKPPAPQPGPPPSAGDPVAARGKRTYRVLIGGRETVRGETSEAINVEIS